MLDCSHPPQVMKPVPHVKSDLKLWAVKGDLQLLFRGLLRTIQCLPVEFLQSPTKVVSMEYSLKLQTWFKEEID